MVYSKPNTKAEGVPLPTRLAHVIWENESYHELGRMSDYLQSEWTFSKIKGEGP